jgi:DHA1 family bicyclomycin/chloramphenicol resistance-like MFS transporter
MPRHLYKYYLGLLAATAPLATDMYLPAIPRLAQQWGTPTSTVNLSLVLWFVAYSVTLLVWGTVSDRFGRRPILLWGLSLFVTTSALCSLAQDVTQLIVARVLQGVAAAGGAAMVMAIARDRFEGAERKQVLAWIAVILGIAPMIAPSIGSAILEYGSWRWVFVMQAALGGLSLALTLLLYQETADNLDFSNVRGMVTRYGRLARNRNYLLANGATGLLAAPLLGFVAFSPVAYIVHFGMTERTFGLMFGANALCVIAGSFACSQLVDRYSDRLMLVTAFVGCLAGGAFLLFAGQAAWAQFAAGMAVYSFFFGLSRPLVNHLVLEQVDRDFGASSSGIVCCQFLCGAIGMAIATHDWHNQFLAFGVIAAVCPLITLLLWPLIRSK